MAASGCIADISDCPSGETDLLDVFKKSSTIAGCSKDEKHCVDVLDEYLIYCCDCDQVYGVDDTMDESQLLILLAENEFRCKTPCTACGNNDPTKIGVQVKTSKDESRCCLLCLNCNEIYLQFDMPKDSNEIANENARFSETNVNSVLGDDEKSIEDVNSLIQCSLCPNTDPNLFEITSNDDGCINKIKCWLCGHQDSFNVELVQKPPLVKKRWQLAAKLALAKPTARAVTSVTSRGWNILKPYLQTFARQTSRHVQQNVANQRPITEGLKENAGSMAVQVGRKVFIDIGVELCRRLIPTAPIAVDVVMILADYVAQGALVLMQRKLNGRSQNGVALEGK